MFIGALTVYQLLDVVLTAHRDSYIVRIPITLTGGLTIKADADGRVRDRV